MTSTQALAPLWRDAALAPAALADIELPAHGPVLPTSFAVHIAAQASLGAAALAAVQIGRARGGPAQQVRVDAEHAVLDSLAWFTVDGVAPNIWDKLSGLYRTADGWVRLHANFAHHRDGALRLLGLPPGPQTERAAVEAALASWRAQDFEEAAAAAGLVVAAARSFEAWDAHPQAAALRSMPAPLTIERIGDAPPRPRAPWREGGLPLDGLRVLELTRILAGPVAGRTLAAYGADVLLVNSPRLPNIDAIADTSRGKLSAHLDLDDAAGRAALVALIRDADVFMQGYRPGALAARGFSSDAAAALSPGIVVAGLSAYGARGPWSGRRGFDSLVQTATGFNVAEAEAFGAAEPRALPLQILDYTAGYLLAFGAQAALLRQASVGGSWHVQVSLAGVGHWLRSLGRIDGLAARRPPIEPYVETVDSGFGRLQVLRHAAQLSATPARWRRPSMPPGSHAAAWP
ncbi:MAG: CoA transferase [Burkholderiales bacterium]|nr:CoA transferase [Burkholderiales bacterium]